MSSLQVMPRTVQYAQVLHFSLGDPCSLELPVSSLLKKRYQSLLNVDLSY